MTQGSDGSDANRPLNPDRNWDSVDEPGEISTPAPSPSPTAPAPDPVREPEAGAPKGKRQRKVAKTVLENPIAGADYQAVLDAAVAAAEPESKPASKPAPEPEAKPARRAAKTRMYSTSDAAGVAHDALDAAPSVSHEIRPDPGQEPESIQTPEAMLQADPVTPGATEQAIVDFAPEQRPLRRVARTRLFSIANMAEEVADPVSSEALPANEQLDFSTTPQAPAPEPVRPMRRIAKTLVFDDGSAEETFDEGRLTPPDTPLAVAPARGEGRSYVSKTRIDHSILWETVAKFEAKQEKKAAVLAVEKANEPVKEFIAIESKKLASPCGWVWEGNDPKERFRYCTKCHLQVYDFEGMEMPEAEALIFKRENRRNVPLYKRTDGKYMTTDCPIEQRKRSAMLTWGTIAACLVALVIAMMIMAPPAPKPEPIATPEPVTPKHEPPVWRPGRQKPGEVHWQAGQPMPTSPIPPVAPIQPSQPQQDNNQQQFWQYPNQPQGGQQISDPSQAAPVQPRLTPLPTQEGAPTGPMQQTGVKNY